MTAERVNEMLHNYREYLGRCKHLEIEIAQAEKALKSSIATAREDAAAPGGQNLDGMPHGTTVGNPTERIALMFADGRYPKYIEDIAADLKELKEEYRQKSPTVVFVEAWLLGLTERERWIIEQQVIDGVTWRELASQHEKLFGEQRTKEGLKKLRARALEKIYRMAS